MTHRNPSPTRCDRQQTEHDAAEGRTDAGAVRSQPSPLDPRAARRRVTRAAGRGAPNSTANSRARSPSTSLRERTKRRPDSRPPSRRLGVRDASTPPPRSRAPSRRDREQCGDARVDRRRRAGRRSAERRAAIVATCQVDELSATAVPNCSRRTRFAAAMPAGIAKAARMPNTHDPKTAAEPKPAAQSRAAAARTALEPSTRRGCAAVVAVGDVAAGGSAARTAECESPISPGRADRACLVDLQRRHVCICTPASPGSVRQEKGEVANCAARRGARPSVHSWVARGDCSIGRAG